MKKKSHFEGQLLAPLRKKKCVTPSQSEGCHSFMTLFPSPSLCYSLSTVKIWHVCDTVLHLLIK